MPSLLYVRGEAVSKINSATTNEDWVGLFFFPNCRWLKIIWQDQKALIDRNEIIVFKILNFHIPGNFLSCQLCKHNYFMLRYAEKLLHSALKTVTRILHAHILCGFQQTSLLSEGRRINKGWKVGSIYLWVKETVASVFTSGLLKMAQLPSVIPADLHPHKDSLAASLQLRKGPVPRQGLYPLKARPGRSPDPDHPQACPHPRGTKQGDGHLHRDQTPPWYLPVPSCSFFGLLT